MSDVLEGRRPVGFVGGRLDRADPLRGDPVKLAEAFAHPAARVVRMEGLVPFLDGTRLATQPVGGGAVVEDHVLLGFDGTGPLFLSLRKPEPSAEPAQMPSLWDLQDLLEPAELAHYAAARSLIDWHTRHGFCAACGHATRPVRAGWSRKCGNCETEHFPRVDPVVIMLAEYEDKVLVGRQPRFPRHQYSALAGFVEPGETMEEAVARELFEEAGVRATAVRYVMSQPWPFPSSLMFACIAPVESPDLVIDTTELEHAMWVDRAGVRTALERAQDAPFRAPQSVAVAHHLLWAWLDETD